LIFGVATRVYVGFLVVVIEGLGREDFVCEWVHLKPEQVLELNLWWTSVLLVWFKLINELDERFLIHKKFWMLVFWEDFKVCQVGWVLSIVITLRFVVDEQNLLNLVLDHEQTEK
jgi:hypothetical protein